MKRKILSVILLFLAVLGIFGVRAVLSVQKALKTTNQAIGAAKLQDLDATKAYIRDAQKEFKKTKTSLVIFSINFKKLL